MIATLVALAGLVGCDRPVANGTSPGLTGPDASPEVAASQASGSSTQKASGAQDTKISGTVEPNGTWLYKGAGEAFWIRVNQPGRLLHHDEPRGVGNSDVFCPKPLTQDRGCGGFTSVGGDPLLATATRMIETTDSGHRRVFGFQFATRDTFRMAILPNTRANRNLFNDGLDRIFQRPVSFQAVVVSVVDGTLAQDFDLPGVDESAVTVEEVIEGSTLRIVGF